MVWRYDEKVVFLPPNLSLICLMGSEKMGFTDDGRMTYDGRPREDSSCAVQ